MRIVVTGASGHVGNTLCRELVSGGHKVKVLMLENPDDMDFSDVKIIHGNILDKKIVDELCRDVDIVFL